MSSGRICTGFELEALWDDSVFGLKHWHDFSHIAVVTDHAWLTKMVNMFKPFFHGEVRLFRSRDCLYREKTGSRARRKGHDHDADKYPQSRNLGA